MDPGWHTYWKNSGASGMPTKIDWELPPGVTAGPAEWPVPDKLPEQDLTTYIYSNTVVLLVPLKLATNVPAGPLQLKANVSWLECDLQCVPGDAVVTAALNVGAETRPSAEASILAGWEKKMPQKGNPVAARAWWEKPANGNSRPVVIEWNSTAPAKSADFFPDSSDAFEVQPATELLSSDPGKIRIRKEVKKFEGDWPKEISGVLVQQEGAEHQAYQINLPLDRPGAALTTGLSLWQALLYAFIGGLILNIMPCVLPVIALKILGFVGQAKENPRRARLLGLIYALGVLVSFLVLAGVVIGLKAAGQSAGWGMQFSSPYFLIVMTTLVLLIALNLFGVFDVSLGGRAMGAAAGLASKHGPAGAFFNGFLATALATSCTAPFLGAAVGFAFAPDQTALRTLLIFLMVGVGLAFPYVVLSWQPAWLKFLPKPGPWMERFKIAMGFPMLAAAVWLFSLVSAHYGDRAWWFAIFLVSVALAAWIYGEFLQRHRAKPLIAALAIVAVLAGGYSFALESNLRWRQPLSQFGPDLARERDPNGVPWQAWSPAAIAEARATGRPVLVDFTATWCLTCNTIVKPALESASVRAKLKETNALPLLADFTARPAKMADELQKFGRAGVPLVLVYPKEPGRPPIVLPEVVTPGMVVNALEQAAK